MDLPHTLHGQLFLLAYDHRKHRFDLDDQWPLGFALRAAMLTGLFPSGHLRDIEGTVGPVSAGTLGDPLLRSMFETVQESGPKPWAWLVAAHAQGAPGLVRDQLRGQGWIGTRRRRRVGIFPTDRIEVADESVIEVLANRTTGALRNASAGGRQMGGQSRWDCSPASPSYRHCSTSERTPTPMTNLMTSAFPPPHRSWAWMPRSRRCTS